MVHQWLSLIDSTLDDLEAFGDKEESCPWRRKVAQCTNPLLSWSNKDLDTLSFSELGSFTQVYIPKAVKRRNQLRDMHKVVAQFRSQRIKIVALEKVKVRKTLYGFLLPTEIGRIAKTWR